jgi:tetratricopeptide (TPR) repeat protein
VEDALEIAQRLKHPALLGRVHSQLLRLHIFTGQVDKVRSHAEMALDLSRKGGDRGVEFWCQWAMGAMEGLIGNTAQMSERIEEARRLADDIGSPLLQLVTAELRVELAYARGDWDEGIAIGGEAIELARSRGQTTILPRLLVWVSLMHLGRGDIETGDRLTREAWEVSRADGALAKSGYIDVHTVVPAHIGRAAYHMALNEWDEAVRIAEAGLAIADRTGYVFWAIHHILPIIAEASILSRDLVRAEEVARRVRREADAVGHPLGHAWADGLDALITWLRGDAEIGAVSLRKGAESLETIPLTYEAARMRRQLAGRLAEIGDREGALVELRHVHEVFTRLGARHELAETIGMFEQIGAEPPD